MINATLIPFFINFYIYNSSYTWQYGPEYVFTVEMNTTKTPRCSPAYDWCGEPSSTLFKFQLHCFPESRHKLICSLPHSEDYDFGLADANGRVANRQRTIADELVFKLFPTGLSKYKSIKIIMEKKHINTHDVSTLQTIAELLSKGHNFRDFESGMRLDTTVGRCKVTFNIHRRPGCITESCEPFEEPFTLRILTLNLQKRFWLTPYRELQLGNFAEMIVDKTTHLKDCHCYKNCRRHEPVRANALESMTSRMEITAKSFVSSRTTTGTMNADNKTYDIINVTRIVLENIQPATRKPPVIVEPYCIGIATNC